MMEKNYTVYKIEYQGEVKYIGKTCDFKRRVQHHKYERGTGNSAIPKDADLEEIEILPIETFDNETDALKREDELILQYDTINTGWNQRRSGLIWSSDTKAYDREWMREYSKGEKYKAYQREYMREYSKIEKYKTYRREYKREWYQLHKEELRKKNREYNRQYRLRKREQEI